MPHYGWRKDLPDQRDHVVALTTPVPLPKTVDLRPGMPKVYDQGQLGSCTANAIAAAFDYERHTHGDQFINPSRLFIYWNERNLEHTVMSDAGASIRDGIKTVKTDGAPPERLWPYIISKFTKRPSKKATTAALNFEATSYARVPQVQASMQQTLATGSPIVIGFTVYESFESEQVADDGIIPMPAPHEKTLGGHAVVIVGYKMVNKTLHFIVRNSWATSWGDNGYCYFPAAYLTSTHLASDLWTLTT